jgi:hypothetical protein
VMELESEFLFSLSASVTRLLDIGGVPAGGRDVDPISAIMHLSHIARLVSHTMLYRRAPYRRGDKHWLHFTCPICATRWSRG